MITRPHPVGSSRRGLLGVAPLIKILKTSILRRKVARYRSKAESSEALPNSVDIFVIPIVEFGFQVMAKAHRGS